MKINFASTIAALLLIATTKAHALQCPTGFQPDGSRCITQGMADYVACVAAIGGNKQELSDEIASASETKKSVGGAIDAKAKGVKGGAGLVLGADTEIKVVRNFEAKWFSSGMSECSHALEEIHRKNSGRVQAKAQPKPLKLPMRVTVKASYFEFFPGFSVAIGYFSAGQEYTVELRNTEFGVLNLAPGEGPTTISVAGKHYTIQAESISSATGVTLVLDSVKK